MLIFILALIVTFGGYFYHQSRFMACNSLVWGFFLLPMYVTITVAVLVVSVAVAHDTFNVRCKHITDIKWLSLMFIAYPTVPTILLVFFVEPMAVITVLKTIY